MHFEDPHSFKISVRFFHSLFFRITPHADSCREPHTHTHALCFIVWAHHTCHDGYNDDDVYSSQVPLNKWMRISSRTCWCDCRRAGVGALHMQLIQWFTNILTPPASKSTVYVWVLGLRCRIIHSQFQRCLVPYTAICSQISLLSFRFFPSPLWAHSPRHRKSNVVWMRQKQRAHDTASADIRVLRSIDIE